MRSFSEISCGESMEPLVRLWTTDGDGDDGVGDRNYEGSTLAWPCGVLDSEREQ